MGICPKAFPSCKLTHLFVKDSLEAFGKVNEAMIGTDLVEGLYNQIIEPESIAITLSSLCKKPCCVEKGPKEI